MYLNLDAQKIVETCRAARDRIAARFPESGLSKVADEVCSVSTQAAEAAQWLAKPHLALRILASLGIAAVILVVLGVALNVKLQFSFSSAADLLQGAEAAINEIVFLGIAVVFFLTLEGRLKRRRALKAIHQLRSLAHIIDMHQITKDPERIANRQADAAASPRRPLSLAELIRYLDNCGDLLALISKIAALYVQDFDDPVTLSAVNEVENLTNGLARKIWQKILMSDRILQSEATPATPPR
jgi:hypothetical protein